MKKTRMLAFLGVAVLAATHLSAAEKGGETNKEPAAPAAKAADLFPDTVIAKAKGFEIKRSQLDDAFVALKANAAARGQSISEDQRAAVELRLLNEMILTRILTNRVTEVDRTKAKETSEKFIADARKQSASEEAFNARLKMNKMTAEELQKKITEEALPGAVLERELKSQVTVTDEQVKKYYEDNPASFEEPEKVRASHILIGTRDPVTGKDLSDGEKQAKRKQIEDLQKRAKAGEDFAKLAKEFSEDTGSKDKGGEYTFPRGQMVPEFEAAAFSLSTNQISDVVTTQYGYHIIKFSEKIPARTVPLSESSSKIKDYLLQQGSQKLAPDHFEKLKKEAGVEILDEKLKASEKAAAVQVVPVDPAKLEKK